MNIYIQCNRTRRTKIHERRGVAHCAKKINIIIAKKEFPFIFGLMKKENIANNF